MTLIYFWEALRAVSKKARSTAQADFRHDYDQGYIAIVMYSEKIARYATYIPMGGKLTLRHYDSRQLAKDFGLPNQSDLLVDTAKVYHAVQDLFKSTFTCTYCRRLDSISR